ncbi:unnamed protein product [Porites evermanni]|uniref:Uncharacterized protein n=1 Tax=Porites evermanni TaxID=104178 RepID=A0ABN8LE62_9CNID|nr:unnamed protein product [Porites evermanni]
MMHSIVNNTAPEHLTSQNKYNFAVPQPRTESYKRTLSYSGSVLWNSLPLEVR